MKLNFRKISAVLATGVMSMSGVAFAAAANYPQPFVDSGSADVAIVYGTGEGVSSLDIIQAGNVQSDLQSFLSGSSGSSSSASGGDSYKFEKTSTKFHLGDAITDVVASSLDDDEMPSLLGDGTYVDADNDEFDFTQKIEMQALQLTMFEDSDFESDVPTIGFHLTSGTDILTYTLDFSDEPLMADLETTDLTLMGKEYYVLDVDGDAKITLLDSAEDTTLSEGETTNIQGHEVSISFIGGTGSDAEVKLNVDGEVTNSLNEGETQKLVGGDYVGVKDISVQDYAGGTKTVEFSVGSGKLILESGSDVELNEDSVDGVGVTITNTTKLQSIALAWEADDDLFIAGDSEITMPGFETVKLSFGGLNYPTEETIEIAHGSDDYVQLNEFPLKDSTEDINLLYTDGTTYVGIGKDADEQLLTDLDGNMTFDADSHEYFVASWNDGRDAESYLMRATNFKIDNSVNKTTFEYRKDGAWAEAKSERQDGDTFSLGNAEFAVGNIDKVGKSVNIANNSAQTNFYALYSNEGITVYLPFDSATSSATGVINLTALPTSYDLNLDEEDKDGDKGDGPHVNVTLGLNAQTPKETSVTAIASSGTLAGEEEIEDTDVFRNFVYSALATEVLYDKGPDQRTVKLVYHGDEAAADVFIASPDTVITPGQGGSAAGTPLGEVLVKDTEVSSVSSKNLVIIGGSCINSAAASALGVSSRTCGSAFTTATGVGSGQFLIKGVMDAYASGKLALVVAGYEAADSVNAAKFLTTQTVDTSKEYLGTSSTSATMVTAVA